MQKLEANSLKQCNVCKKIKDINLMFFYSGNQVSPYCKECTVVYYLAIYESQNKIIKI
jgi:hypothetical protein